MGSRAIAADPPAASGEPIRAKDAAMPAAPIVPGDIVSAMQEGKYDAAGAALTALAEKAKVADDRAYFTYLRAIAERLAGKRKEAVATLHGALEASPKGPWSPKIRNELSGLELAAGNLAVAEELARNEATRLLADERKDRLAEIYQSHARRLLQPEDPIVQPDPNGAWELFNQARELAKSPALRAGLLFSMGRASHQAGNLPRAIENLEAYLRDYPKGSDRLAVRLRLGEVRRQAGELLPARLLWSDLAREIEGMRPEDRTKDADEIRAAALAEIPSTYQIPNPPDDANLNLGVAALRRFLAAYPAHPRAVRAAYDVGASYLARGKSDEALAAFGRFLKDEGFKAETDAARRDQAELVMTATFQSAQVLQGQQKYAEAIAAYRGYLTRFPNGPQSADAQRAILDAELLIAADHVAHERYAEARAAWGDFVTRNPLDPRVPELLFQAGETFLKEKKPDEAIAYWAPLTTRFPTSEPAAHALFLTAAIFENEKGDLAGAIDRFRKIAVDPWKAQALQRVAVMESKALTVVTPRIYRTGEMPKLRIASRNLEKLTFTAYRLNAEAYFRKKHALANVESLDIGLVAPDAEWTVDVPGQAKYKPVEADYELAKLEKPAVYVVKVTDQKHLQATTLVVASDIDAIVKSSREQVLVFAQDMKTGKGRPKAKVLVSDAGQVILEAETGADGVLVHDWSPARDASSPLSYLVLDGGNVAGSGLAVPNKVSQGLSPRAYIYTDRPAYRPGQAASIRGVIREIQNGQYANSPAAVYRFEISDSRGRQLVTRNVTLSEFGTFHESLQLERGTPVGTYKIRVFQPGKSDFTGAFEVQSYQLEPIDLTFALKKTVFYRGETIEADVVAKYQYGAPLAARPLEINLPDGRILHGETDSAGKFHFTVATEGFAEDTRLRLVAKLTKDNVQAAAAVQLATRGFDIAVSVRRDVLLDGESFPVKLTTTDAKGDPIGQSLSLAVIKRLVQAGRVTEREAQRKAVETDPKTGEGNLGLRIDDPDGGSYILRASGTDRFGNPIVADLAVQVSGKKDETRLRILADRQRYKVGERAEVNLHSRGRAGTALLTWEADRILSYRIVTLKDGDNPLAWPVDGPEFPNFTLTASRMWENVFDHAKLDVQVERELAVTLKPTRPSVGPGEDVELEVTAVDQLGKPVAAELSIAMIDRSLLRLHGDRMPPIASFFYDQTRTGAFATESSNTFRYVPATTGVARAVVDEAERLAAMAANAAHLGTVQLELKDQMNKDMPADSNRPGGGPADSKAGELRGMAMGGMGGAPGMSGPAESSAGRKLAKRSRAAQDASKAKQDNGSVVAFQESDLASVADPEVKEGVKFPVSFGYLAAERNQMNREHRERFAETAYWNPSVVTGKDGKARLTFKAPGALSDYQIVARGVTGNDTLVGQATSSMTIRKDFFVDLKIPAGLTQGDKPRLVARVHHVGVQGTVALRLTVYAGGREEVFPKALELKGDGVDEVLLDPFEVPDTDSVRLTLVGKVGAIQDEVTTEVPVRSWGVQAYASESGTSSDGTAVFVGLPKGRTYESPEMVVLIAPTLQRMIIELALGRDYRIYAKDLNCRIMPPPGGTMGDRAGDLLAATSALGYVRATRAGGAPDAERIASRIQGLVAELTAAQNEDGGWPWVAAGTLPRQGEKVAAAVASERLTSASVFWALATAEQAGLLPDPKILDKAAAWLTQAVTAGTNSRDLDARATLLHALSTRHAATFEMANTLNRERQGLSNTALAYLALTFANLNRAELGAEVASILVSRAKVEATAPGRPSRLYWDGSGQSANARGAVETTALAALALARVRPQGNELDRAAEWLHAHRFGYGWNPHRAKGPALAALALYHARSKGAEDRYRLTVSVNETKVAELNVAGSGESQAIRVPLRALKAGDANRVGLAMEGRGTFSYSVTMTGFTRDFGPEQDRNNRPAWVDRRVYWPAPHELDGKVLPSSFGVAVNADSWENTISQVALGGKGRVGLVVWRNVPDSTPEWERDFLVVEEQLPAGTTLIEGSVITSASSYTLADGVLTFYFAPDQNPGGIQYDVYGYLPGQYRALPTSVRSAYDPGRQQLGQPGELKVLAPGEKNTDPYRITPDELYTAGKIHFDAGRYAEAAAALEPLFAGYSLRDDVAKDAARMLLLIHITNYDARKVVQYFEVIKEKAPDLILDFDKLLVIGKAYRDINEYERAIIVWRGLVEASYLEDARIGELLRQRGKTLEATAYLIDLWRSYPNTPSIESDFFGLSQILAKAAAEAFTEPNLRRELAAAGITRSELLLQTVRLIQVFLSQSPTNPMADEASLALVNAFIDLEDYPGVVKLAARFAATYPKSTYQDAFQYSEALANFHLNKYDRAVEVAERISKAVYKDPSGVDQPSPNKWQAIYILGQIFDARRAPGKAIEYYKQVADRFTDAASAIQFYTRKELKVPEVSIVRLPNRPAVAGAGVEGGEARPPFGLRAVGTEPAGGGVEGLSKPGIKLEYRNIGRVEITAYPVDLMQLYLTRRNLNAIAGIDLAGITPLVEKSVELGSGSDYEDASRMIELPLTKEGAYLVMIRGENLYASGIVLVTPIDVEILEESCGRVRVTVRDARTKALLPKVQVKVIGTNNPDFLSGETDLRGVFVADGVQGQVTAVARKDTIQYAFYRGTSYVGTPPTPPAPAANAQQGQQATMPALNQSLDANLRSQNSANYMRQIQRLENRYNAPETGKPRGAAAGGFR